MKYCIFSIYPNSSSSPDHLSGIFYQTTWSVIAEDIMLPIVDSLQLFSYIRPISLCNVSCKIIANLIDVRLSSIMPKIITNNQSGFVKERSIAENILMTQELLMVLVNQGKGEM